MKIERRRILAKPGTRHGKLTVLQEDIGVWRLHSKGIVLSRRIKVRCKCGNVTSVFLHSARYKQTKSCGCDRLNNLRRATRAAPGKSGFNHLYSKYRISARKRSFCFELSRTQFKSLVTKDCHYCGCPPSKVSIPNVSTGTAESRAHSGFKFNGIDRIDSTRGYEPDNVVPCCTTCNYAKRDLSLDDFRDWITRLTQRQSSSPL